MSVTLKTSHGDLKLELDCTHFPEASFNFLALCAAGYYDGVTFHRNCAGAFIQGGDPTGTGKGGESIWRRPFDDTFHPDLLHDARGVLSMATRAANRNGSQFIITYTALPHLDNQHTCFGRVIDDGDGTLEAMERVPVDAKYRPQQTIEIQGVVIHANPLADSDEFGAAGHGAATRK